MGNVNGREGENGNDDPSVRSDGGESGFPSNPDRPVRVTSFDSMGNSPPQSPGRSISPLMFAPQVEYLSLSRFLYIYLRICSLQYYI